MSFMNRTSRGTASSEKPLRRSVSRSRFRSIPGLSVTIVDKAMPPSYSEGIRFTLGNEELPGYIEKLRNEEHVALIIVISHLGFPQEMKLASQVSGIDVLLSAHTHNRLFKPHFQNGAILIQSGCHGSFIGRLDLGIEDGRIVDVNHRLIAVEESIEPDKDVQHLVDTAMGPYRKELSQVVGRTMTSLDRYLVLESTMDNLLLDSLLDLTGARVAFSNGWRYGAPIAPGPVTLGDLWNIIPVNPPVSTCTMKGEEIWTMLEENLERTFARDPYRQMGGYVKRCAGLNMYFKIENPEGHRIQELFIDGERLLADRTYRTTFVTAQGVPAKYGADRNNLDVRAIDALKRYLSKGSVESRLRASVVAI